MLQSFVCLEPAPELGNCRRGNLRTAIDAAHRCKMLQQQSDPTAYLQQPLRPKSRNPPDRASKPLPHLLLRDRHLRVAAVPTYKAWSLLSDLAAGIGLL